MGMDPKGLEASISDRTSCVITTQLYGTPCRVREIARIAEAHGAVLLEDCAHSLGARVGGRSTGSVGRAGYFSFETSKILNTMGGGMITTDDRELAERRRKNSRYIVDRLSPPVPFQGTDEPDVAPNPMLLAARFANALQVARALLARGIDTKRGYMRDCSGLLEEPVELPNAARVDREALHVPAFPALTEPELDRVATALEAVLDELGE